MAIIFPKKPQQKPVENPDEKLRKKLLNGLRILAFGEYKKHNYKSGLSGNQMYQEFAKEWFAHEIHSYSLPQLNELVKSMGYTVKEIIEIIRESVGKLPPLLLLRDPSRCSGRMNLSTHTATQLTYLVIEASYSVRLDDSVL